MPTVTFKYDIKKDAWSWVHIAKKDKSCWGLDWRPQVAHIPDDLLSKILKLSFPKAQIAVEKYLKNHPKRKYRELVLKEEKNSLEKLWKKVEKNFFNILSDITQQSIYRNNFKCFFTTGFMCPYNLEENWFMVSMWHSLPSSITTICHELLHFQFLHYYKGYLKKEGLNNRQIETLKEALTFLLNEPEFKKVVLVEDQGYPDHQKLRKALKKVWQDNKEFDVFLKKALKIVKK